MKSIEEKIETCKELQALYASALEEEFENRSHKWPYVLEMIKGFDFYTDMRIRFRKLLDYKNNFDNIVKAREKLLDDMLNKRPLEKIDWFIND